jgi:hypothetical protein
LRLQHRSPTAPDGGTAADGWETPFAKVAAELIRRRAAGLAQEVEIARLVEREFTGRRHGRPIAGISRED